MKTLCQRDPKWSEKLIGKSPLKIGRYGCTLTGLSMLTSATESYASPDKIAIHEDWFTKDGLILWDKLKLDGVTWEYRDYHPYDDKLKKLLKDKSNGILLHVQGNHWVVCTGTSILGGYTILDPWLGDSSTTRRYKNEITGAAYFKLKLAQGRASAWQKLSTQQRVKYARIHRNLN